LWEAAPAGGVRLVTVPEALEDHEPEPRPLRRASWGEDKDFSTWDSPPVADLAWAARRLELRLARAGRGGVRDGRGGGAARGGSSGPPRRATGPSSTAAARRAITPGSGRAITRRPSTKP